MFCGNNYWILFIILIIILNDRNSCGCCNNNGCNNNGCGCN